MTFESAPAEGRSAGPAIPDSGGLRSHVAAARMPWRLSPPPGVLAANPAQDMTNREPRRVGGGVGIRRSVSCSDCPRAGRSGGGGAHGGDLAKDDPCDEERPLPAAPQLPRHGSSFSARATKVCDGDTSLPVIDRYLEAMVKHRADTLVFRSGATVTL